MIPLSEDFATAESLRSQMASLRIGGLPPGFPGGTGRPAPPAGAQAALAGMREVGAGFAAAAVGTGPVGATGSSSMSTGSSVASSVALNTEVQKYVQDLKNSRKIQRKVEKIHTHTHHLLGFHPIIH